MAEVVNMPRLGLNEDTSVLGEWFVSEDVYKRQMLVSQICMLLYIPEGYRSPRKMSGGCSGAIFPGYIS